MRRLIMAMALYAGTAWAQFAPVVTSNGMLYVARTNGPALIEVTMTGAVTAADFVLSSTNRLDDLRVSPNGANPVGLPDAATLVINSGAGGDQLALQFADAAINVAATAYQMPHSWVSNTVVWPHIHFSPTTTGTGDVVFASRIAWANIGDPFPASTITTNTYTISTNSQWKHMLWEIPAGGISGTGKWFSSVINWRFERLGTHSNDTYTGAIDVYSVDLHYRHRGAPVIYNP